MNENQKKAYQEKLDARMAEMQAQIDKLEAKAKSKNAEASIQKEKTLEQLKAKQADIKKRASELKASSSHAWDDITEGIESAWKEISQAASHAKSNF